MANSSLLNRVLRTDDRELAESTISTTYEPTCIETPLRNNFNFMLTAAQLDCVMAGRLQVRSPTRVFGRGKSDVYHICVPLAGRVLCRGAADGQHVITPGQASLWAPGQIPDTVWSAGATQMCFMIPPAVVEMELEAMIEATPSKPVGLAPIMNLTSGTGESWWRLVTLLAAEFAADSGLMEHSAACRHFERLLISGLLLEHEHAYADKLRNGHDRGTTGAVAQVVELIEADPAARWSVLDLARRAHVSARALQEAFQREYGTTPMRHLRQTRLRRIRDELLEAPTGIITVQASAKKWGFQHMGRFSAYYQWEFDELPSETLRWGGRVVPS